MFLSFIKVPFVSFKKKVPFGCLGRRTVPLLVEIFGFDMWRRALRTN
jgi:hypothetical protein